MFKIIKFDNGTLGDKYILYIFKKDHEYWLPIHQVVIARTPNQREMTAEEIRQKFYYEINRGLETAEVQSYEII
jgi:hypothetical protein